MSAIGVFDSGIGGLTVLKTLAEKFPAENFIYLGDTARLPYGTKSPQTIRKYSEQIIQFLISQKVKAIVIACNSASSVFQEKEWQGIPVFNVITPGVREAIKNSSTKRIGILGTRATVQSEIYKKKILELDPEAQVFQQACPLFVPLAEEGWLDDPVTNLIVYRYLQSLVHHQVDTIILACTHYPLLRAAIQKVVGNDVKLVESGQALCEDLKNLSSLESNQNEQRHIQILCTDLSSNIEILSKHILNPIHYDEIRPCDL